MDHEGHSRASGQLVVGSGWKRTLRRRLGNWYRRAARDLPWRRTRDPYAIWVSEVMLQQTQVESVKPYYDRFLRAFPDIRALAGADERSVLRLWEGLGYYRRARQLHQAAKILVAHHGAQFPRDANVAMSLPGIGRYTAGAVLSIAFDSRLPILEANTVRLLTRLLAYDQQPTRADGQRLLWSVAQQLLPRRNTGLFNQALMELGSEICTPRAPRCDLCPVAEQCETRRRGWQEMIPRQGKKVRYQHVHEVAVVIRHGKRVLLRECMAGERWAGLWDFPRFAIRPGRALERTLIRHVHETMGLSVKPVRRLTTIKHAVTRFRITLDCYELAVVNGRRRAGSATMQWVRPQDLEAFPLSATGRQISRLLA